MVLKFLGSIICSYGGRTNVDSETLVADDWFDRVAIRRANRPNGLESNRNAIFFKKLKLVRKFAIFYCLKSHSLKPF